MITITNEPSHCRKTLIKTDSFNKAKPLTFPIKKIEHSRNIPSHLRGQKLFGTTPKYEMLQAQTFNL